MPKLVITRMLPFQLNLTLLHYHHLKLQVMELHKDMVVNNNLFMTLMLDTNNNQLAMHQLHKDTEVNSNNTANNQVMIKTNKITMVMVAKTKATTKTKVMTRTKVTTKTKTKAIDTIYIN